MENKAKRFLRLLLAIAMVMAILPMTFALATETGNVAKIGDTEYETLKTAINAANGINGGATITLLQDVTLGEKLTISGNVTISGAHAITRADTYTGTLFAVNSGATLTLDGGLVIDGGNNWTYVEVDGEKKFLHEAENYDGSRGYGSVGEFVTPEPGVPVATADLITVSGTLILNNVSIQNNWGKDGANVVDVATGGQLIMNEGAKVTHNVTDGQGPAVKMNKDSYFTMNGGEISWNAGRHHGGGAVSIHGGYMTMNDGSICNNFSVDGMGVAIFVYDTRNHSDIKQPTFLMEGGEISNNVCLPGPTANRNGTVIYARNGIMEMNGGSINNNYGRNYAGIGVGSVTLTITGGSVVNNQNVMGNTNETFHDLVAEDTTKITGGIFTQDVSEWCAEGFKCEQLDDGTWGVVEFVPVADVNGKQYETLKEAIEKANAGDTITFLADITENVTVNKNLTIDGAKFTYTGKMTLKADTTIKNVNFDGKGYNGYAVETRGAQYLTIEDCTAKNYGYGFVQLASATALTTVKNVTVSNMNYGVKIDYSTAVVLENVDMTANVAAVLNSNYGEKTVTIKNSKLNIYGTWTRNNTTKTTIVFEGANTIGEFKADAAIDTFKLADVNSTLTAPEGQTVVTDVEGYEVTYKDGKYQVVEKKNPVAEVNGVQYETLADAIAAAKAGDTITFLADITEDVTIGKKLTIDGAKFTYTGKMTLKADTTIKNVNFDGKGYNGYAVETRGAQYLTIEDCTAKNYGYGFVQLASATALTTIKNVTVSNMNYGVKIDYSGAVVLENVDMTANVAAVLNSNYGEKTITIKNSKLNIYGTWTRNNTTKTNIVFEGENTIGEFKADAAIDTFKLADVNSTLTAPEGQTVVTDVEGYEVVYSNGMYKVVKYVAAIGENKFESLQAAIDAAQAGDTIKLLVDINHSGIAEIAADANVNLDLNGHVLTADAVRWSGGNIVDKATSTGGVKIRGNGTFELSQTNIDMPIYDRTNGYYRFFAYTLESMVSDDLINVKGHPAAKFGIYLRFTKLDAYALIADQDATHYVGLSFVLTINNENYVCTFKPGTIAKWAAAAGAYYTENRGSQEKFVLMLAVKGLDVMEDETSLTIVPTVGSYVKTSNTPTALYTVPCKTLTVTKADVDEFLKTLPTIDPTKKEEESGDDGSTKSSATGGDDPDAQNP